MFILTLFTVFISGNLFGQQTAIDGIIDLKNYQFKKSGSLNLNGVWEFYPEQLYSPSDFSSGLTENAKLVNVPSLWNNTFFDKQDNFNIGYGTYRLKVFLPDNINMLALRLKRIESAYILWINNDTLVVSGKTATNKDLYVPTQKTLFKFFAINGNSFDITLQVSNFEHRKGGIDNPITLGLPLQITNESKRTKGFEIFIIGVLLIMAVFHFGLYIAKRSDYSLLFFGLLLTIEMFSLMTNGEVLFMSFFPDMSWVVLKKIDYISNFLRVTFLALFFYKLYEEYMSKIYVIVLTAVNVILIFIVLFTSLLTYSFTLMVFIGTASITMMYILYVQVRSIFKKKAGAFIPFLGTFILLITAVNDILYVSDVIETMFLTPVGMFIFIFSQAYILSFNFSNLYKKTEELNMLTADSDKIKNRLLDKRSFQYVDSLEILTKHGNGTRGLLFSVSKGSVSLKAEFPEYSNSEQKEKYPATLISEVIKKKELIISNNPISESFYNQLYIISYKPKSSVCIPLKAAGKIRGLLYLENDLKKHAFQKQDAELFQHISDQIIGTTDNIEMYKELQSMSSNLEKIVSKRTKDIRNQNEMLEEQKDEIEAVNFELNRSLDEVSKKNLIIKDSIIYAKYLQDANLPDEKYVRSLFKDSFILYKPKEILSGDFYWVNKINDEKVLFALADCTGHGVPGALISVMGYDMLNNVSINKKIYKPSEILNSLQTDILNRLAKDDELEIKDGMEIAVIAFDKANLILEYSGARINLIIFRNGKLTEVKADRMSISAVQHEKIKGQKFTNHKIQLKENDIVYLYSDGFQDQFGGASDSKFMKKNFRTLLQKVNLLSFPIQRSHMLKALNQWQGSNIQNDDILVVGLKF